MKKQLILITSIFLTILALIGCVKKIEKVTTVLSGRVIEESQSMPLNNVNVVVTNGNQEYTSIHTGVTGTFKLNVTFDDLNDSYYLYLDDGNHNKKLDLKGVGRALYDYKDIALYKDNGGNVTTPTITTTTPTNISNNSAICGGNVTSDGGAAIIQRGICYSTSQNPTTENNVVTSGNGTGSFTCNLMGLTPNTKYYVKAYAINSQGTSYGTQKNFTTSNGGGGAAIEEFIEGFESGLPSTWATIDADGDGNTWYSLNPNNNTNNIPGHNSSLGHMTSASYNNGSVLTPDNYLVTPLIKATGNSTFSFYACAQDNQWAEEHFGVFVSTNSQTNANSFVKIQEWTMSAKGSGITSIGRNGQTRDQGNWYQYTVSLANYANQNIYVAIRHFNCTDMFRLNVDDVELSTSSGGGSTTATIILAAGDLWSDGSGYQMLLDNTHSLYGTTIPTSGALSTNCSGNESIYSQFSHKIPTNADGNCSTQNIVFNNSVTITIPAGIYDWCITNPTPNDRIWIASSNGNVGGRQDNYEFEAGNTYEFVISKYGDNDGVDVTITGGAKGKKSMKQSNEDCKISN